MDDRRADVAFLFDVDNTLLDNDSVKRNLIGHSERLLGPDGSTRFWELYEEVRRDYEYVDFPHTLQRFTRDLPENLGFPEFADIVLTYPYHTALYRGAHEALKVAATVGPVAILSDGDPVFQPAKIARARGPTAAAHGPVLVFAHKEEHVDEIMRRVPAERYVAIDDKPRIHRAMKEQLGERVTTMQILQGDYASQLDPTESPADVTLTSIEEFLALDLDTFRRPPARG